MTLMMLAQAADTVASGDEGYLYWGFILFGVAAVLLIVELFVPSGGLIAVLCGVAAIGSIVAFFMYDTGWGLAVALAYVILGPIAILFGFRLWAASSLSRRMVLGGEDVGSEDPTDASFASERARRERLAALQDLLGAEGETETALRPVGTVRINGQRVDAMAETGVIPARTPIVVCDVYDNQIKVRPR